MNFHSRRVYCETASCESESANSEFPVRSISFFEAVDSSMDTARSARYCAIGESSQSFLVTKAKVS